MSAPHPLVLNQDVQASAKDYVARIRSGIHDKQMLLREVGEALKFPYWVTPNWDGFGDWIGDLSWIPNQRVVVIHDAGPHVTRKGLVIYLEILARGARTLREGDGRELIVGFPEWTRALADAWSGVKTKR